MADIINIEELIKSKKESKEDIPETFTTIDIYKYISMIEYNINSLYNLALKGKEYQSICTSEQFKILAYVYDSFFKILYNELDILNKDEDESSSRILFEFALELYNISKNLQDVDVLIENVSKKALNFKKGDNDESGKN